MAKMRFKTHDIWIKLKDIHQSKDPARRAALLISLMSMKIEDKDDAREYTRHFFDIVDRLADLEVDINQNVL